MTTPDKITELIREAAVSVFVCDEEDKTLIDQYNAIMNCEHDDELASEVTTVWEPFEYWEIGRVRQSLEAHEQYLQATVNSIITLILNDQGRETG